MDNVAVFFLLTILSVAAVAAACYITVMATYWFELRHRGETEPPEWPTTP
ncbi:hypothetical protein ACTD5D_26660 [Nocardia takedensis]|nr:hypothetical protein [Nocardia takedensis]